MAKAKTARRDAKQERKADVVARLASLKGQSRSDLVRDDQRQGTSPLGMGSHSKLRRK